MILNKEQIWVDLPPSAQVPIYNNTIKIKALCLPEDLKMKFVNDEVFQPKHRNSYTEKKVTVQPEEKKVNEQEKKESHSKSKPSSSSDFTSIFGNVQQEVPKKVPKTEQTDWFPDFIGDSTAQNTVKEELKTDFTSDIFSTSTEQPVSNTFGSSSPVKSDKTVVNPVVANISGSEFEVTNTIKKIVDVVE